MQNKDYKLIWIAIGAVLVIILIVWLAFWLINNDSTQEVTSSVEVQTAANLDDFTKSQPQLLSDSDAAPLGLNKKEIASPVPTKIKENKITMVPEMIEGGDALYQPVVELPGNKFFVLTPSKYKDVFSINNKEDALKYLDFVMVQMGRSNYERTKQTVRASGDYEKIGCKANPEDTEDHLPTSRQVSQSQIDADGNYEIQWVYFTPAYPAGYYKEIYIVDKNGNITNKEKPGKPFWSCGQGVLF